MKPRRFFILLMIALCWIVLPASASRLGDIRVNARFLTDRMAYELRLSSRQYNDIFEINYDFFYNVDPYIDRMSYGDPYALDMYYRYLDERNDDIRWVLSRKHYRRFMSLEHFFLPIYAVNRVCYIRIYNIYPNRTHFYYGRPSHYFSYRGGHCRHHYGGVSFYQTHYRNHYKHSVYTGSYQSRRISSRGRDFPTVGNSGSTVSRPIHSSRHSVITDGNRTSIRHNTTTVRDRSHGTSVRDRSRGNSVRTRSDRTSVSDRSRSTSVKDRSRSTSVRTRSTKTSDTDHSRNNSVRERTR